MSITHKVDIQVCTKNRVGEICVLLQALRTQTFKDWSLCIFDDGSQVNTFGYQLFSKLINKIRSEKHQVKLIRNDSYSIGVCKARNKLIDDGFKDCDLVLRIDDDVIPDNDYIERLVNLIDNYGADIASGVTPPLEISGFKRESKFCYPVINKIEYDQTGKITKIGDDCGMEYMPEENGMSIIPTPHFRSCALYKKELTDRGLRYEEGISFFREEAFFSIRAILMGAKIYVDTNAKVFHYMNNNLDGGCRDLYRSEIISTDERNFYMWMKRQFILHGDFLGKYYSQFIGVKDVK